MQRHRPCSHQAPDPDTTEGAVTAAVRREIRNARRRTRFTYVVDAIPLYDRPCGCLGSSHYLPMGITAYQYSSLPAASRDDDLAECKLCLAVWRQGDVLT